MVILDLQICLSRFCIAARVTALRREIVGELSGPGSHVQIVCISIKAHLGNSKSQYNLLTNHIYTVSPKKPCTHIMANNIHIHRPISMPFERIVLATLLDNLPWKLFTQPSTSCNCYHGNQRTHAGQDLCYYSAPAHRARATIEYLRQATPDLISPDVWPPNSPDPPVDYRIRGCLQDPCLSESHKRYQRAETAPGWCMLILWADNHWRRLRWVEKVVSVWKDTISNMSRKSFLFWLTFLPSNLHVL